MGDIVKSLGGLAFNLVGIVVIAYLGVAVWINDTWGPEGALAWLVAPLAIWLIGILTARYVELRRISASVQPPAPTTAPLFTEGDAGEIVRVR